MDNPQRVQTSGFKIRPYCVGVDVSDIFFNSMAERLAIYSEIRYISRIFPTLFSKLISIFIRLLHTFSMGAKIRARDYLGANSSPSICAVAFFLPPTARAGVLEPSQK